MIEVVHPAGIEPATFGLGNRCSVRLSYGCAGIAIAMAAGEFKQNQASERINGRNGSGKRAMPSSRSARTCAGLASP